MTSSGAGTGDALPLIELAPEGSSGCSEIYDPHAANGRDFWTAETASIKVPLWRLRQRCGEMPERTTVGAR